MPTTFERLVHIRSQLAEEVMDYLTRLASEMDQIHWRRGGECIKAGDIAVEPFVLTKRERPRASRLSREGQGSGGSVRELSWLDEIEARRYELPKELEEREELRWRQVVRRGRARLVLKGAPGSGKTFMTRQAVAELARTERATLDEQLAGTEAVAVPMWVTAKALAQTGAAKLEDALPEAIENSLGLSLSPNVRGWMKRALSASRVLIVVDALDELTGDEREKFAAKAKRLDDPKKDWRVVVTCRTMHWEERRSWLPWGRVEEVELSPFKRRQQREFTRKFFGAGSRLAHSMESLLRANYSLRHACATPLMLTFACVLQEEGAVHEGTSYAVLYGCMLRKMFSGEWRGVRPPWTGSEVKTERHMHDVEGIARGIFSQAPQQNLFKLADWGQSAAGAGAMASVDPADLLEQLQQVGLIVPAGFDEKNDRCWSFVHRTFLEFLAARALSRKGTQAWIGEARKHFWFEPEWLEVLTFLAGHADDATPLIEAVEKQRERDDLFGSMLYLKARLIGAATSVDEQVARRVSDEVLSFWQKTMSGWGFSLRQFALPMLAALAMHEKARGFLIEGVLESAKDEEWYVRMVAAEALGSIGSEQAFERLLELTEDKDGRVRGRAAEELGTIGTEQTVERLIGLLKDKDGYVSIGVNKAFGSIGSEQTVERLLELTEDEDERVCRGAAAALGSIGAEQAVERLLELTKDEEEIMRMIAARALGRIGAEQAIERLLELLEEEDFEVRMAAAEALGTIGSEQAVERLLELTMNESGDVCMAAAEALGSIGAEQVVERLLELTEDEDESMRMVAAKALGTIGSEQAIERLLELTEDDYWLTEDEWYVRVEAADALGSIGNEQAVERLLELTEDEGGDLRTRAAEALGTIGSEQAVERLIELTKDDYYFARGAAAKALGRIGDERAVKSLLKLRKDKDWVTSKAAVEALWRIAWKHKIKVRVPRAKK